MQQVFDGRGIGPLKVIELEEDVSAGRCRGDWGRAEGDGNTLCVCGGARGAAGHIAPALGNGVSQIYLVRSAGAGVLERERVAHGLSRHDDIDVVNGTAVVRVGTYSFVIAVAIAGAGKAGRRLGGVGLDEVFQLGFNDRESRTWIQANDTAVTPGEGGRQGEDIACEDGSAASIAAINGEKDLDQQVHRLGAGIDERLCEVIGTGAGRAANLSDARAELGETEVFLRTATEIIVEGNDIPLGAVDGKPIGHVQADAKVGQGDCSGQIQAQPVLDLFANGGASRAIVAQGGRTAVRQGGDFSDDVAGNWQLADKLVIGTLFRQGAIGVCIAAALIALFCEVGSPGGGQDPASAGQA